MVQTALECIATFIVIFGSGVLALRAGEYLLGGRQNDNAVDCRRCQFVTRHCRNLRSNPGGAEERRRARYQTTMVSERMMELNRMDDGYEEPPEEEPDQGFCSVHGWHTDWKWEWSHVSFGWYDPQGNWVGRCQVRSEDDLCGEEAEDYAP